ncbi:cytochrome P450 [Leucobacter luti]|uniref:Cytochrome P450 n=1 Tax=Leucobacter luti TaxID=340320 RepID=A0A4Q7U1U9_9MICO|nr:cytochrome P450 [Leucobacter luti]MBL3699192.1 cytochrome P450 [Leucobacter luti]RZT66690.1 cytochrome P450 [Leucobacter luti]
MTGIEAPIADWVTIPELYRDPFLIYERLRAEGGVHWVPAVNRFLITSYEAVHQTELDQEVFSANERDSLQIRAMGHSMLRRDDPEHYLERKAWQPALRPGVVKRTWTEMFHRNAKRYLAELVDKGPGADLIWDFAAPYAAESLREVIGLYNATQEDLQRWSQTMIDATGNYADDPEVWARGKRSFDEVDVVLDEMLAWHQKHPDHTLLSTLLRIPDYEMPIDRIRANVKMTIGGGLNEPRDALGVTAWALLTHPEQRAAVAADRSLWSTAFDESLRWVAPIGLYSRQTTRAVDVAGVRLPSGAKLGICILSANRDEQIWDRAPEFDLRRESKPHLAFGKGVHVCLGAWVARAQVADVGLPLLFESLEGLRVLPEDPPEIGGWVFRGMTKLPVSWTAVRGQDVSGAAPASAAQMAPAARGAEGDTEAPEPGIPAPRIAIVGSGPSGSFSAQALRRTFPAAPIDVFDALPTPYGLVRYGVAPDHQGTKSVTRQFDRLFLAEGVRFTGETQLGRDVTLPELRAAFDVVVLATGLHRDRPLPVPGATLPGVRGAGAVTRVLTQHPDEPAQPPLGARVVVLGHGNVAMDVVRLLARDPAEFDGSDVDDPSRDALVGAVRTIHLVGRSGVSAAKFDPVMVRELAGLTGVHHVVHGAAELPEQARDARVDAVRELVAAGEAAQTAAGTPRVRVEWWFAAAPTRIVGADRVTGVAIESTGDAASVSRVLPADDVITAIGFEGTEDTPLEPGAHPDGRVEPGLYTAGWLRRGPRGTIPDQRTDARDLALTVAADLASGAIAVEEDGAAAAKLLARVRAAGTDFDGWRRIDLRERLTAAPGRERAKLASRAELRAAAGDLTLDLPPVPEGGADALAAEVPLTVLFGTESGGAELVSEELAQVLGAAPGADVRVHDLAEIAPEDLDADRMHLLICSTYGDGEVPTSARPFHRALVEARPDLTGIRYAVFGMGDRSYDKTYSRGSELVDEALTACGAARVGEYGRHDAGGPLSVTEAAREWASGVLAAIAAAAVPLSD